MTLSRGSFIFKRSGVLMKRNGPCLAEVKGAVAIKRILFLQGGCVTPTKTGLSSLFKLWRLFSVWPKLNFHCIFKNDYY